MVAVSKSSDSGWVAVQEKDCLFFQGSAQPGRTLDTLKQPQESGLGGSWMAFFPPVGFQVKVAPSGSLRPLSVHVRLALEPRSKSSRAGGFRDRLGFPHEH